MINTNNNIIIESREKITVSGVSTVEGFDTMEVSCITNEGPLLIKGDNLHVEKLDLENNELIVTGLITQIEYMQNKISGGFFTKLFK